MTISTPSEPSAPDANAGGDTSSARRRHPKRRVLLPIVIVLAVLLAGSAAAVAWYALSIEKSVSQNIHRSDGTLPAANDPSRPAKSAKGVLDFVLVGSDSRDKTNAKHTGRSDSLMLVHLDANRQHAYIISFPRDMWVDIPGHGKAKINAAYAFGGPKLTVSTLEKLVDVRIDHLAIVDFEGFIQLTDDLGGVTVNNKHYSKSHGYEFPKGKITIKGQQALWYVRERHQLPNGDLDRAERQRTVVKAVIAKGLSPQTISNPAKFTKFMAGVAGDLTVDAGLTDAEIRKIAVSLRLTGKDVTLMQAPISGFGTSSDGQSIDVVDEPKLDELSKALRSDTMADYATLYPQK